MRKVFLVVYLETLFMSLLTILVGDTRQVFLVVYATVIRSKTYSA